MKASLPGQLFFSHEATLHVFEIELELHGIFWFHSIAEPREKYVHVGLPLIHNYPLTLAFLGRPVDESYVSIAYEIKRSIDARAAWDQRGFYVYPATASRMYMRQVLFSMGGTGYLTVKAETRASVPDLTSHQVFLPGSVFRTYLVSRSRELGLPQIVRLGAKRYGVFKVHYNYLGVSAPQVNADGKRATHPFNVRECPASSYHAVMSHHAGDVAVTGVPKRVAIVRDVVLALPGFI